MEGCSAAICLILRQLRSGQRKQCANAERHPHAYWLLCLASSLVVPQISLRVDQDPGLSTLLQRGHAGTRALLLNAHRYRDRSRMRKSVTSMTKPKAIAMNDVCSGVQGMPHAGSGICPEKAIMDCKVGK